MKKGLSRTGSEEGRAHVFFHVDDTSMHLGSQERETRWVVSLKKGVYNPEGGNGGG